MLLMLFWLDYLRCGKSVIKVFVFLRELLFAFPSLDISYGRDEVFLFKLSKSFKVMFIAADKFTYFMHFSQQNLSSKD